MKSEKAKLPPVSPAEGLSVGELVHRYPETLEVFEKHGVHFCAGCFITLDSQAKRAAGYHAVDDIGAFMKELAEAVAKDKGHRK